MDEIAPNVVNFIEYHHAFNKAGDTVSSTGVGHCISGEIIEQARDIYSRTLSRYVSISPALCVLEDRIKQHMLQGIFCGVRDEDLLAAAALVRAHGDYLCDNWVRGQGSERARMLRIIHRLSSRLKGIVSEHLARQSLDRPLDDPFDPPLLVVRQCRTQLERVLNELGMS
ncbi:MAG: hypothetical protein AAB400_02100 [Patescibacteria group bacterium]